MHYQWAAWRSGLLRLQSFSHHESNSYSPVQRRKRKQDHTIRRQKIILGSHTPPGISKTSRLSGLMVSAGRSAHAKALLGQEAFEKIRHSKVLVVGAGGIGCELCKQTLAMHIVSVSLISDVLLVKNLVLVGFGNIEIVGAEPQVQSKPLLSLTRRSDRLI